MKKNTMMRIASVLLIAVLMTTCVISGTFAKYAASATGSDTVTVAEWAFKVGDTNIANATNATKTFTFDLFNTIKDTVDGNTETHVEAGKIAPGTTGQFQIVLQNTSDVTANYSIAFEKTGAAATIPIQFSLDNSTWGDNIPNDDNTLAFVDDPATDGVDETKDTITVYWKWDIGTSGSDNEHGVTPGDLIVTANITVEQVD